MDPSVTGGATAGLEALLGGLNPEQLRAVTHGDGPLLVVAGAGTGKTQVITRRIAWLIATHRAKPSEILALTFTDKAADEMAVRVDQLVPYGYTDTAISTFHAFGDRLIREHALELGLPTDLRVLTRAEVVIFLREHLFEFELDAYRPLGDPTRFLAALATLFSRCKDEDISPADYAAHADRVAVEAAALGGGGGGGRRRARTRRRRRRGGPAPGRARARLWHATSRCWRPTAASTSATRSRSRSVSCERPRPCAPRSPGRFRYILVDEFQDTNRAQAELVAALAERHRNVTVVGDDDQAIYAFRGAAIDNILDFRERYVGARTVVLRRNYRSLAPVLDAAYRLIRFNDPDRLEVRTGIVKRLRAQRSAADPAARPPRGLRHRLRGGGLDRRPRSAGASRPVPRPATTRSSSGPTAMPTRSCARSTWPASRGGSPGRRGSTPAPRSGCCSRSCASSPTSARAWTCMRWRHPRCTRLAAKT